MEKQEFREVASAIWRGRKLSVPGLGEVDLLARAMKLAVEAALEEAADYVSQHDNCGDIASKEIRDLILAPAEIEAEMIRRMSQQ